MSLSHASWMCRKQLDELTDTSQEYQLGLILSGCCVFFEDLILSVSEALQSPCSLFTAASERHFEWLPHNLIPDALRRCILDPVTTIKWPEFRDLNVTKTKQYTEVSMEQTFSGGKFNKRTLKAKVTLCYCVAVYT